MKFIQCFFALIFGQKRVLVSTQFSIYPSPCITAPFPFALHVLALGAQHLLHLNLNHFEPIFLSHSHQISHFCPTISSSYNPPFLNPQLTTLNFPTQILTHYFSPSILHPSPFPHAKRTVHPYIIYTLSLFY